jgi:UDP-N-acetyl-2-amino-2-deoxyglucuronate dehydrogenase
VKTWGFAVIGCGNIADFHINAIRLIPNAKLVGVSSRNGERAREISLREGCAWTASYTDLLSNPDVDIVCLTTSSGSHARIGLDVLNAGKHLLVEKPIAMRTAEADRLIRLADEKGLTISVVSQRRFEEQHQLVHNIVSEGRIGKLLLIEISCPYFRTQAYYDSADWRGTIAEDGGALMNQGIHSIDLMLWLGGPVRSVYGKIATQTHKMEAEDIGLALLKFENGAMGTIMSSTSIHPGFAPSLNLYGEHGTITIEGTSITHWTVPDFPMPKGNEEGTSGGGVADPRNISNLYHQLQISDLIEALVKGRQPLVTGGDGKRSVQLIEAIYQSSVQSVEVVLEDEGR